MTAPAGHTRINDGLLAAAEKRVLVAMARRLPAWITSDHLTGLALTAMAMAGGAFWLAGSWRPAVWGVVLALAINWFGDSLDGTLARVRGHERPRYGYYVDHVLDVLGISMLVGGMALSGMITPLVASAVLVAYLLAASEVYLATAVRRGFRMSFLRFGPTELRVVLAAGALALLRDPYVAPFGLGPWLLFDVGGAVAAAGLLAAFLTSAARNTVALYREERLPASEA